MILIGWIRQYVRIHFRNRICKEIAEDIPNSLLSTGSENIEKVSGICLASHFLVCLFFKRERERERDLECFVLHANDRPEIKTVYKFIFRMKVLAKNVTLSIDILGN